MSKILILDNFDSFTWNLVDYFFRCGVDADVIRNDVQAESIRVSDYAGLVLSPGPESPKKAGCLLDALRLYHNQIPILGICLGHQAIGEFFGAKLVKGLKPMHGKISATQIIQPDPIFENVPEWFKVVRYHSLVLEDLPEILIPLAYTAENELMALKHKKLPIYGLQFHPEAILTEDGLTFLKNWLSFNNIVA